MSGINTRINMALHNFNTIYGHNTRKRRNEGTVRGENLINSRDNVRKEGSGNERS